MYETFDLLRCAAEDSRKAARKLHGGIGPTRWEALLDRVEEQLEADDRDGNGVTEPTDSDPLHSCAYDYAGLPPTHLTTASLSAAALTGPALPAFPERSRYQSALEVHGSTALS